jgi:uncharacterized protein
MPVRLLSSSVLKWPDAGVVDQAFRLWAQRVAQTRADVVRVGYFGSYARGDWGVGSDLDVVIVVEESECPFDRRSAEWDTSALPVPTDVLVYTLTEWQSGYTSERFHRMLREEAVWVYSSEDKVD